MQAASCRLAYGIQNGQTAFSDKILLLQVVKEHAVMYTLCPVFAQFFRCLSKDALHSQNVKPPSHVAQDAYTTCNSACNVLGLPRQQNQILLEGWHDLHRLSSSLLTLDIVLCLQMYMKLGHGRCGKRHAMRWVYSQPHRVPRSTDWTLMHQSHTLLDTVLQTGGDVALF